MTGDIRRGRVFGQEVCHVIIKEEGWKGASACQGLPRSSGN